MLTFHFVWMPSNRQSCLADMAVIPAHREPCTTDILCYTIIKLNDHSDVQESWACLGDGELEKVGLEEIGLRSHLVNIICGLQCTGAHDVDSNITQWKIHAAQIRLCGSVTIGVDALTAKWSIHAAQIRLCGSVTNSGEVGIHEAQLRLCGIVTSNCVNQYNYATLNNLNK